MTPFCETEATCGVVAPSNHTHRDPTNAYESNLVAEHVWSQTIFHSPEFHSIHEGEAVSKSGSLIGVPETKAQFSAVAHVGVVTMERHGVACSGSDGAAARSRHDLVQSLRVAQPQEAAMQVLQSAWLEHWPTESRKHVKRNRTHAVGKRLLNIFSRCCWIRVVILFYFIFNF